MSLIMEKEIYEDYLTDIDAKAFDTDFDDIAFDPIEVDDSDDEAAEEFDY